MIPAWAMRVVFGISIWSSFPRKHLEKFQHLHLFSELSFYIVFMICAFLSRLEVTNRTVIHHKMFGVLFSVFKRFWVFFSGLNPLPLSEFTFESGLFISSGFLVILNVWFLNALSLSEKGLGLQIQSFPKSPYFVMGLEAQSAE